MNAHLECWSESRKDCYIEEDVVGMWKRISGVIRRIVPDGKLHEAADEMPALLFAEASMNDEIV